jgi:hypothetical protein
MGEALLWAAPAGCTRSAGWGTGCGAFLLAAVCERK